MNVDKNFYGIKLISVLKDHSTHNKREMKGRRLCGFILKIDGETHYNTKENCFKLKGGDILFISEGSYYTIAEVVPGTAYVVNFEGVKGDIQKLTLSDKYDLRSLGDRLYNKFVKNDFYGALSALYDILSKASSQPGSKGRGLPPAAVKYLESNITDPDLTAGKLAEVADISEVYLRKLMKMRYGMSTGAYIIKERINIACRILEEKPNVSINNVAACCGYSDAFYFSRIFKKVMGVSPGEYRKLHLEDLF